MTRSRSPLVRMIPASHERTPARRIRVESPHPVVGMIWRETLNLMQIDRTHRRQSAGFVRVLGLFFAVGLLGSGSALAQTDEDPEADTAEAEVDSPAQFNEGENQVPSGSSGKMDKPSAGGGTSEDGSMNQSTGGPFGDPDSSNAPTGRFDPCDEYDQRRKQLQSETRGKIGPIKELVNIGNRAIRKRFFEDAKESYESAVDVARDLEARWHGVVTDIIGTVSSSARFNQDCTLVVSKCLSEAIALKDLLYEIYPLLGQAYFMLENYDRAAEEIQKSVTIQPDDPKTWRALGRALLKAGRQVEAIKAFDRSVRLDRYQPDALYELAVAHAKNNDIRRAVFYLKRSVTRGFNRFEQIEEDQDFVNLRGDPEYEELVYHGPGRPY